MDEDKLRRIETKLDCISEAVTELRSMWPHLCRRIDKLETEIYGNDGKVGLIGKIQSIHVIAAWIGAACGTIIGGALLYLLIGK
jgi:hypothetical protein